MRNVGVVVFVISMGSSVSLYAQQAFDGIRLPSNRPISDEFVIERTNGEVSPHRIRDSHAINGFYQMLGKVGGSGSTNIDKFGEAINLSSSEMHQMISISERALSHQNANKAVILDEFCASPEYKDGVVFRDNVRSLLSSLDAVDAKIYLGNESYFESEVTRAFGAEKYNSLLEWITKNIKPYLNEVKVDHYRRDISLGRDPLTRVMKVCN